ncbi:MAG TPA: DUF1549 domain-containing protein, partial [Pirellulales bacterium]
MELHRFQRFCSSCLPRLAVVLLIARAATAADGPPVNYSEQIKPILSSRCYACHGPDAAQRKADLELHIRDKAIRDAIVPGDAAGSSLVERITSTDADLRMPPPDSKKPPLTAEEIELVKRWIDEGAKFDAHWSYLKPQRAALPAIKNQAWPHNPIDYFIAARHEEHGLAPAPEADRRTLIRRLSFDLTGLPPRPADIAAFLADQRGNAYDELVDRLLASPQFGERMAAYWLDVVRYADSGGYHSDNDRQVWLYRDYVIAAFNDDMPFDRFTIEQLAGDLLPGATREQRIASGYNRLLQTTEEGGAQPKEYTAKYSADRVRNTAAAWLGATLGCAECHDHKFDPFTTKDFYRMAAFFADLSERAVGRQEQTPLPTAEEAAEIKRLDVEIAQVRAEIDQPRPELAAAQAEWERELRARKLAWTTLAAQVSGSPGGAAFKPLDDGSILATGASPEKDTYVLSAPLAVSGVTALRLEVLPDDSLPAQGPGRAGN